MFFNVLLGKRGRGSCQVRTRYLSAHRVVAMRAKFEWCIRHFLHDIKSVLALITMLFITGLIFINRHVSHHGLKLLQESSEFDTESSYHRSVQKVKMYFYFRDQI